MAGQDFFYPGGGRREALEAIFEGVYRGDAVLLLVGSAGAGRSSVISRFCEEVDPQVLTVVTVAGDILMSADAVFGALSAALGMHRIGDPRGVLWQAIARERSEGRNVVLIVDDAHELGSDARSGIVSLARDAGVGLLLAGDESLAPVMDPEVAFEVIGLRALSEEEAEEFVAGWLGIDQEDELPSHRVMARLHKHSAGMPGRLAGLLGAGAAERVSMLPHRIPLWHVLFAVAAFVLLAVLVIHFSSPGKVPAEAPAIVEMAVPLPRTATAMDGSATTARPVKGAVSAVVPKALEVKPFVDPVAHVEPDAPDAIETAGTARAVPEAVPEQTVSGVPGGRLNAVPSPKNESGAPVRYTAEEQALLAEGRTRVALQLFASFNEPAVRLFQRRHPEIDIRVFRTVREDLPWYVAVTGSYRNRDEAREAVGRLPRALQELSPWARSVQSIQDELRRRKD